MNPPTEAGIRRLRHRIVRATYIRTSHGSRPHISLLRWADIIASKASTSIPEIEGLLLIPVTPTLTTSLVEYSKYTVIRFSRCPYIIRI